MSQLVRLEGKHSTQNAHCALFKEHKNAIIRMQDKTVITGYMIFQSNTKIIFEKVQKKLSYKYKTNIY